MDSYLYERAGTQNNPRGLLEKNEIEMEVNSRMKNEMNFNLAYKKINFLYKSDYNYLSKNSLTHNPKHKQR